MQSQATLLKRRFDSLRQDRLPHENHWRQCFDYSHPIRGQGFNGEIADTTATQSQRARMYDATSTDAGNILASGIQGGMTPANSRWFGIGVWDSTSDEESWLDESSQRLWEAIHASNFDAESFEANVDMVDVGWFVLFIDENRGQDGQVDGFRFAQWPIASCYLAASKPGGRVDTLFRPYRLTVEQCVNEFGLDQVGEKVRQNYLAGKMDEKVDLLHAIYPRQKFVVNAVRARNLPFASEHIECDSGRMVRESGFHEQPFVAPRWSVIPNSVYATGPMSAALPDILTLNELSKMELLAADLAVSGMWIAQDDGVLNPRTVKVGPRKIIIAADTDNMKELKSGSDFTVSFTKREELRASIRKILLADQLQPKDGPAMTATEVHVRVQMIRQLLGPIFGRLQAEYLQPLIERCFGLALRGGLFEPPPESLRDRQYRVIYLSPLAKAQKMEEVSAIEGTLVSVGQVAAATGSLEAWDNIDLDEGVRHIADGRGMPAQLLRSPEAVAALREQRAQAQAAAQQQAAQQAMAQEMAKAGAQRMANAA